MAILESEFHQAAEDFLDQLFKTLSLHSIDIPKHWDIDHLCFRVSSNDQYENLKINIADFAELLTESPVAGRMISTFKLNKPVFCQGRRIDLVELPAPKTGKKTIDGFEHLEIVCDVAFTELESRFQNLKLDRSGLRKPFNQELEIEFGAHNVKFHHLSLESVIRLEENVEVMVALNASGILKDLADHHPLVVGTFPLGLDVENSDLDILLFASADRFAHTLEYFSGKFGSCLNFQIKRGETEGLAWVTVSFQYHQVPFEVFIQNQHPTSQRAFRHFQIEERLLKLGGKSFKNMVKRHRSMGKKTEPAFADILGLNGDAFQSLESLTKLSDAELLLRIQFPD